MKRRSSKLFSYALRSKLRALRASIPEQPPEFKKAMAELERQLALDIRHAYREGLIS